MNKKRFVYGLCILLIVPAGLATRSSSIDLPSLVKNYGGDVLYATMIFFIVRFLFPKLRLINIAALAYFICISIEILQLYKAPWLEKLRHTFPFGLILGYGFLWSDWICYAVGVFIAFLPAFIIEKQLVNKR